MDKKSIEAVALSIRSLSMDAIQKANVILVIPEKSLILDNQEPTTASVTLYSAGGAPLEKKQVRAIQNLIKTAVEGLRDNDITIVGPFFLSCDHSCYHGQNSHGVGLNHYYEDGTPYDCYGEEDSFTEKEVYKLYF